MKVNKMTNINELYKYAVDNSYDELDIDYVHQVYNTEQSIIKLRTFMKVKNKYFVTVKLNEKYDICIRLHSLDLYYENDNELLQLTDLDIDELINIENAFNKYRKNLK
jgi:hypothetical protein